MGKRMVDGEGSPACEEADVGRLTLDGPMAGFCRKWVTTRYSGRRVLGWETVTELAEVDVFMTATFGFIRGGLEERVELGDRTIPPSVFFSLELSLGKCLSFLLGIQNIAASFLRKFPI